MIDQTFASGVQAGGTFSCDEAMALLAHDLRTSIMVIHGYAVTLARRDEILSAEQRDFALTAIARHSEGLLAFSEDVLDIVRAENGSLTIGREPVDLGELAAEVTARAAPDFPAHSVRLDVEQSYVVASGDRRRVGQVIENFIRNACRYSPPGTAVEVAVRRGPDFVGVTVFDGGPPLPPEVAADPFGSVRVRPDRGGGGAGLGLYLCRLIVESLGGRTWAESDHGGVTFGFLLPVSG